MAIAVTVFFLVLFFVVRRPRGLNEAIPACLGAATVFALRLIKWTDILWVGNLVWNATLALIAIMVISAILDAAGFFRWAALRLAFATKGSGTGLFYAVVSLAAVVTVFFNNDGSVLIMTPIIYSLVSCLGLERRQMIPFLFGAGFIADTASAPLLVSNLVNILASDYFHVSFSKYARYLFVPGIIAILTSVWVLRVILGGAIPKRFLLRGLPDPADAITDPFLVRFGLIVLTLVVIGYFAGGLAKIPVSIIAAAGAILLSTAAFMRKTLVLGRVLRRAPWHIVAFAFGMYLVVQAMNNQGMTNLVTGLLRPHSKSLFRFVLINGFQLSALSGTLNNLPATLTANTALSQVGGIDPGLRLSISVIANGIGCKLTPIGSLATLLWIHVLRQHGFRFTWREYLRIALIATPAILLSALLGAYGLHILSQ